MNHDHASVRSTLLSDDEIVSACTAGADWAFSELKHGHPAGPWLLVYRDLPCACPITVVRAAATRWALEAGPGGRWV